LGCCRHGSQTDKTGDDPHQFVAARTQALGSNVRTDHARGGPIGSIGPPERPL
jgi:hypothetical protein